MITLERIPAMRHILFFLGVVSIFSASAFALITVNGAEVATRDVAADDTLQIEGTGSITVADLAAVTLSGGATSTWTVQVDTGGSITNNSALTATLNETTAGGGNLTLTGGGTITNLNAGGNAVAMGAGDDTLTLDIGIDITGALDGGAGADTLILTGATGTGTFGGDITTFETITKQGAGTWQLNGTSGFDTALNVNAGTLSVGAAGTLDGNAGGGGPGDLSIASGASLTLSGAAQNIANFNVSGGTFTKTGIGDLNTGITNFNVTNGGTALLQMTGGDFAATNTTINGGTMSITSSTANATALGVTAITSGSLVVNHTVGTVTAGTVAVNNAGILNVASSLGGAGGITVNSGGTVMGVGAISKAITVGNGGTMSPGASIGTLTMTGNYVQQAGGTMQVELNATQSDLLDITGAATLAGNLNVVQQAGSTVQSGKQYTIIQTTGGITGTFGAVTDNSFTLNFEPIIAGNDMLLEATRVGYLAAATTAEAKTVGAALDPIANTATGDMANVINALDSFSTSAGLSNALEQLSMESHSHVNVVARDNARMVTGAIASHMQMARAGQSEMLYSPMQGPQFAWLMDNAHEWAMAMQALDESANNPADWDAFEGSDKSMFGRFLSFWGDEDTTAGRTGFNYYGFGGVVGQDFVIDESTLAGWSFTYLRSKITFDQNRGHEDVDTFRIGPHFTKSFDKFYVDLSATYGFHWSEAQRNINIPGLMRNAYNQHASHDVTLYMGAGTDIRCGKFILSPQASMQYMHLYIDDYNESGAGAANLNVDGVNTNSLRSTVGGQVAFRPDPAKPRYQYNLWGGWAHEFMGDDNDTRVRFAGGGNSFTIDGSTSDRDSYYFGGGIQTPIRKNMVAYFAYNGEFTSESENHILSVSLRLFF